MKRMTPPATLAKKPSGSALVRAHVPKSTPSLVGRLLPAVGFLLKRTPTRTTPRHGTAVVPLAVALVLVDGPAKKTELTSMREHFGTGKVWMAELERQGIVPQAQRTSVEALSTRVAMQSSHDAGALSHVVEMLCEVAAADGVVSTAEIQFIRTVCQSFVLPERVMVEALSKFIMPPAGTPFEVLGLSEQADLATVKKAYRNQVALYHPDRLSSLSDMRGVLELANKRFDELTSAYDTIRTALVAKNRSVISKLRERASW